MPTKKSQTIKILDKFRQTTAGAGVIDAQLIERHRNKTLLTLEMSHYPNFK